MYATSSHVHNGHNPPYYSNHFPNGHQNSQHSSVHTPPQNILPAPQRPVPPTVSKDPITVVGIPSVSIQNDRLVVGSSQTNSTRSYTPLKVLGDGSFGTVWLCDWHGTLPPNTPLSPMQCGAGARPEWAGKRLVAVKRMKKKWEGGWEECQKLKELESLRAIPFHPNIIPLYDFFLLPASKELYFVFESMEGNLYHLIKARKGRPLAGGLVSSIFRQIVSGLDHIHSAGYFHRDMKPENVLVTTTGLFDYASVSLAAPPKERDVVAIIKLADFGLARETKSKPPYTEYVSTRWYRAPEVLLLSREYSNPVDMWALGTIMAELVNLRPLFPGSDQIDQVARICEVLGDPSDEYGLDSRHNPVGGGVWPRGIKMAKAVGFQFPKIRPKDMQTLFDPTVPVSLVHCIRDLLKYDPDKRLTSRQCLEHAYLRETTPRNNIPIPSALRISTSNLFMPSSNGNGTHVTPSSLHQLPLPSLSAHSSLQAPHIHPSYIPDASASHRSSFQAPAFSSYSSSPQKDITMHHRVSPQGPRIDAEDKRGQPSAVWSPSHERHGSSQSQDGDYPMDIELPTHLVDGQTTNVHGSPMVQEFPARPVVEPEDHINGQVSIPPSGNKLGKLGSLSFGKKHGKWSLGMFGGDKSHHHGLPPLEEVPNAMPSLKRIQSSSTDSKSIRDLSPVRESPVRTDGDVKKTNKKEAERVQREAEKQRRKLAEKMHREQARAVMQKRNQMMQKTVGNGEGGNEQRLVFSETLSKGKQASSGPIRQNQVHNGNSLGSATISAAAGRFAVQGEPASDRDWRGANERLLKARRREFDDDHSMSSSDVHSLGRVSSISFASVDSDPGPARIRNRPSLFGINRMTSMSSLRTSFDEFSPSARSSNSFSLEGQLAHDFDMHASVNARQMAGSLSPPPMQTLSLSPTLSPPLSPSPPWIQVQHAKEPPSGQSPPYVSVPLVHANGSYGLEVNRQLRGHSPISFGHPPSAGNTPTSAKSAINPIFEVPPLPPRTGDSLRSPNALPPFSQLEAIAGGELSPMSFDSTPSEDT